MARPKKKGLEYFTNDVNFYQDIKIRKLIRHKGIQAVSVYHILLCQIYSNGYYLTWDEDLPFIISEIAGLEEDKIVEYINYYIEIGLLDKNLYEQEKVISSPAIQERYIEISVAAKRKLDERLPYLLVNYADRQVKVQKSDVISEQNLFSSEETAVNLKETPINSEKSTQSKVKKRKVKHSSSADAHTREAGAGLMLSGDQSVFDDVDAEISEMRQAPIWREQVFMRFIFLQANDQMLDSYLQRWGQEVKISGKRHQNLADAKHHFTSWMTIQEEKLNKQSKSYGTDINSGYRTSEDIYAGAAGIIHKLRTEGSKPKRELPVV